MLIMGKRFFGRVDRVPGLFYVATSFVHLFWFPLVPLGTSLVLERSERAGTGGSTVYTVQKIGLSFKSLLLAYLRAIAFFTILIYIAGPILKLSGVLQGLTEPALSLDYIGPRIAVLGAASVFLWLSYRFTAPSTSRAVSLGEKLGYSSEAVMQQLKLN